METGEGQIADVYHYTCSRLANLHLPGVAVLFFAPRCGTFLVTFLDGYKVHRADGYLTLDRQ